MEEDQGPQKRAVEQDRKSKMRRQSEVTGEEHVPGLNAEPKALNRMRRYIINLDATPEERWREVITDHREEILRTNETLDKLLRDEAGRSATILSKGFPSHTPMRQRAVACTRQACIFSDVLIFQLSLWCSQESQKWAKFITEMK